ncbi:MAG TPA: ROK family transcriptional regulator [Mycobacteriales bacterium]|nr:ROK family transcriptional regulator [Mycobacteriales bacterium]
MSGTLDGRAGSAAVRRANLALVLQHLRADGPRSRADLAVETALNKATISSLVGDLLSRGLVRETGRRTAGSVGRPAHILELDGRRLGALGLEVNVGYLAAYATDLAGRVLLDRRVGFATADATPASTLRRLVRLAASARDAMARHGAGLAGIAVAAPGLVDVAVGEVVRAPNLGWSGVAVSDRIAAGLGIERAAVRVDNEANFATLAEFWFGELAGTSDLVYLSGEVGVGGGVIAEGRLIRGADGFSGEVGHIALGNSDERCACGRTGCWETAVGFRRLLELAGYSPNVSSDPEELLQEIVQRAAAGESRAVRAFDEIGRQLGAGAAILVNLFNPRTLVLGGYFGRAARQLVPEVKNQVRSLTLAGDTRNCQVAASSLGLRAAARGAAGLVVESVLADPASVSPWPSVSPRTA